MPRSKHNVKPTTQHTPNGFDPLWIEAINHVLEDRDNPKRIKDLTDLMWDRAIGPAIDKIEDMLADGSATE